MWKMKMKRTGRQGGDENKWREARERELEVEKCVGGKESERERQRKTDGDLGATVTPGLVLFIQGSQH